VEKKIKTYVVEKIENLVNWDNGVDPTYEEFPATLWV